MADKEMADKEMPLGVTKLKNEDIASLLRNLIKINKDKDYDEYLISVNEEMLAIQKKILKTEKTMNDRAEQAKSIGLSEASISKLVKDELPIINSQLEKQNVIAENAAKAIKKSFEKSEKKEKLKELKDESKETLKKVQESVPLEKKEKVKIGDTALGKKVDQKFGKVPEQIIDQSITSALGPLPLIIKPLEDFFKFSVKDSIKDGTKKVFTKKDSTGLPNDKTEEFLSKKVRPKRESLLKSGVMGAAAVYMADEFTDALGAGEKSGSHLGDVKDGILGNVTEGISQGGIAGLVKAGLTSGALLTGLGIAGLATSIIWGIFDGIKAYGQAEEWGVSGVSAAIAGFFAGGEAAGGIKNAFKNAGKFALMGASIGLLGGPVGVLAGGLIGAAFGGIVGFIGAENLAKGFDKIGEWVGKSWNLLVDSWKAFLSPIIDGVVLRIENIKDIWNDDTSLFEKIKLTLKELVLGLIDIPLNYIKGWGDAANTLIKGILGPEIDLVFEDFKTEAKKWIGMIFDPLIAGVTAVFDGWKVTGENIGDIWADEETTGWEKIKLTLKEIVLGYINGPIDFVKGTVDTLLENEKFTDTVETISDFFTEIKETITNWIIGLIPDWVRKLGNKIGLDIPVLDDETAEVQKSKKEATFAESQTYGVNQYKDMTPDTMSDYSNIVPQLGGYNAYSNMSSNADKAPDLNSETMPIIKFWNWLTKSGLDNSSDSINDGIVMSNGKVVKTNPDDNIIATKESPLLTNRKDNQYKNKTSEEIQAKVNPTNTLGGFNAYNKPEPEKKEDIPLIRWGKGIVNFLTKTKAENAAASGIEDGIVMSNGKVVKTHPDDNIIATKNNPLLMDRKDNQVIQKEIEKSYFNKEDSKKNDETLKKFDTMITYLSKIAEKTLGNNTTVVESSSGSNIDFNSLRMGK